MSWLQRRFRVEGDLDHCGYVLQLRSTWHLLPFRPSWPTCFTFIFETQFFFSPMFSMVSVPPPGRSMCLGAQTWSLNAREAQVMFMLRWSTINQALQLLEGPCCLLRGTTLVVLLHQVVPKSPRCLSWKSGCKALLHWPSEERGFRLPKRDLKSAGGPLDRQARSPAPEDWRRFLHGTQFWIDTLITCNLYY